MTWVNVIRRIVVPTPGMDNLYDVHLELTNKVAIREIDGGSPGDFPPVQQCDADEVTIVQHTHDSVAALGGFVIEGASWPSPPTAGNLLFSAWMADGAQGDPGDMDGWNKDPDHQGIADVSHGGGSEGRIYVFWKIADGSEDTTPQCTGTSWSAGVGQSNHYLIEVAGVDEYDTFASGNDGGVGTSTPGVLITPAAGRVAFLITFQTWHLHDQSPPATTNDGTQLYNEGDIVDGTNPGRWIGYKAVADTTGSYDINPTLHWGSPAVVEVGWGSLTLSFLCSGSAEITCPKAGQWTDWAFLQEGDGSTTTFTLPCPYADGGLHVKVDGSEIIMGLTQSDPAAGEFTLDFAPKAAQGDSPAEQVWVRYQGR